jgi:hypothetical protein
MSFGGRWENWRAGDVDGYALKAGFASQGEVRRQPDGKWKASFNGRELGSFADRDQAMGRVEEEIALEMRLAISDLANFQPKRPAT